MIINDWYERRRLRLLAEAVKGRTVLDVGYSHLPNPYLDAPNVVGVDIEPPAGEVPYAETIVADVAELPKLFPGRRFDTVIAGELIEHLEDPYGFLRSIHGVLEDDGSLVLSTPNPFGFPVFVAEWLGLRRYFYAEDHTFYFSPRWVERLLVGSGFELVERRSVGLWFPKIPIPWAPIGLSYQVIYVAKAATRPVGSGSE